MTLSSLTLPKAFLPSTRAAMKHDPSLWDEEGLQMFLQE